MPSIFIYQRKFTFNSKISSVNVKIFITRFGGKCKYNVMVPSGKETGAVTQCVGKSSCLIYRRHLYLPNRKPQGNTVLDLVIVLYMPVKRQDLIFFFKKC